jgi:hypothetical protein
VIGRHIADLHGLSGAGLAYYRAHGPAAGSMWAALRARLEGPGSTLGRGAQPRAHRREGGHRGSGQDRFRGRIVRWAAK